MLPFFIIGMLLKDRLYIIENKKLMLLWSFIFIVLLLFWRVDYLWYESRPNWIPIKKIIQNRSLVFDSFNLWCCAYRYSTGVFGSIAIISLFYHFSKTSLGMKFYKIIGKYGVYSLHVYIIQTFLVELNIFRIDISSMDIINKYACIFIISVGFVVLSIIIAKLLERNKLINSFIFGKFK